MMEEIHGTDKGLEYVGEHICHVLVDAGPVGKAVDPSSVLAEIREMEGLGSAVPA